MARRYFGTDGIRGLANGEKLTPELAMKVGMAAGLKFVNGDHRNRVVIGKDTRRSGYMIESALTAGFTAVGMDVYLLGPMPTPAVAMLTRSLRADLGVMISASHNPFDDNGIKLFRHDGYKLSDALEDDIEQLMDSNMLGQLSVGRDIGRAHRDEAAQTRYIEYAKRTMPKGIDLSGLRVVLDCANGAAYKVAPTALWELGAEVFVIGNEPDGFNINDKVGSTAPEALIAKVKELRADIGIALDGDADRVIIVDEKGEIVDGDQFMAVIAQSWHARGELKGGGLVATVMSNLGLERYLGGIGLSLERTQVGDRYVLEAMRAKGFNVGGEQSGHIILSDFTTTGDGLIAGLQLLAVAKQAGRAVSEICKRFDKVPQLLQSVRYKEGKPLEHKLVQQAIKESQARLGDGGRLVIRPSGTEPVIRVMVESDDEGLVSAIVSEIAATIKKVA
ncbi:MULTISPECIES: phosphoglucosamine mutase [unclassified Devosia]|jgi:phosphoglucosamine mutase|uniref:phosphoglucosamine mutase n=1 Tax=unclassified Devosia TaxID=196773 RepID=UPI00086C6E07|nr:MULTISPECIES: phosphoglucosamine mutase [unclassified Devosia]MBN9363523.1 phosphoglucosamine mutase [Devosia sp.]ODS86299.1 MAG: phosphoglucosamine mutase [Devosia sp. SCN 66-27]OJX25334.1 MAG: phosphoglucosamine mutase [Devosia sp. 66-14]